MVANSGQWDKISKYITSKRSRTEISRNKPTCKQQQLQNYNIKSKVKFEGQRKSLEIEYTKAKIGVFQAFCV